MSFEYRTNLDQVNWAQLVEDLIDDDFHNGRTQAQLRRSFENSTHVIMAWDGGHLMGTARALSDGVGNAYVIDVWTQTRYRNQGVATRMMQDLLRSLPGQHVYLQTDDAVGFYLKLGFSPQPEGLSRIVGTYLDPE
ncbi:MAG: GNAT family N-acetyltransferase [Proteobacteria bacterium]|nr:GNAT family N-acetyltransferase [Pseudomonadota bacterium]